MNTAAKTTAAAMTVLAATLVLLGACSNRPTAIPAAGPTNLSWTTVGGIDVPRADQGPHNRSEPAPTGYEHSETGAALAAINAAIRVGVAPDDGGAEPQWATVTRDLVAPGRNKDWWIAQRTRITLGAADPAKAPQVLAYTVPHYRQDHADIDVYCRQPDQSLTVNHLQVAWTALDDWGLILPSPEEQTDPSPRTRPRIETTTSIPDTAVHLR